eukprot:m.392934 g.392934  ORF g.392934 m.392934 type:complete len:476 (-) comp20088_c6_seq1:520-1947(-)
MVERFNAGLSAVASRCRSMEPSNRVATISSWVAKTNQGRNERLTNYLRRQLMRANRELDAATKRLKELHEQFHDVTGQLPAPRDLAKCELDQLRRAEGSKLTSRPLSNYVKLIALKTQVRALESLCSQPHLLSQLGATARKQAGKITDLKRQVEKLEERVKKELPNQDLSPDTEAGQHALQQYTQNKLEMAIPRAVAAKSAADHAAERASGQREVVKTRKQQTSARTKLQEQLDAYEKVTGQEIPVADAMAQQWPWAEVHSELGSLARVPVAVRDELFYTTHLVERLQERIQMTKDDAARMHAFEMHKVEESMGFFRWVAASKITHQPSGRCPVHQLGPNDHFFKSSHLVCQSRRVFRSSYVVDPDTPADATPRAASFRNGFLCLTFAAAQYFAFLRKRTRKTFSHDTLGLSQATPLAEDQVLGPDVGLPEDDLPDNSDGPQGEPDEEEVEVEVEVELLSSSSSSPSLAPSQRYL